MQKANISFLLRAKKIKPDLPSLRQIWYPPAFWIVYSGREAIHGTGWKGGRKLPFNAGLNELNNSTSATAAAVILLMFVCVCHRVFRVQFVQSLDAVNIELRQPSKDRDVAGMNWRLLCRFEHHVHLALTHRMPDHELVLRWLVPRYRCTADPRGARGRCSRLRSCRPCGAWRRVHAGLWRQRRLWDVLLALKVRWALRLHQWLLWWRSRLRQHVF